MIIPAITEEWIERILEAAAEHGAQGASWIMLRLPHEVAPLFREWLAVHFPDRADKVMHLVQSMRGGKDNSSTFHTRMKAARRLGRSGARPFQQGAGKARLEKPRAGAGL